MKFRALKVFSSFIIFCIGIFAVVKFLYALGFIDRETIRSDILNDSHLLSVQKARIERLFQDKKVKQFGMHIPGVINVLPTGKKVIALTFDACGSQGDGFDRPLINFLVKHKVKATLFISQRWAVKNNKNMKFLLQQHLFQIENHGWRHLPCAVQKHKLYGISSTTSLSEIFKEIQWNSLAIYQFSGIWPRFYRAGTAYYDSVCVAAAQNLGYHIIGFSILGDAGASYNASQVKKYLLRAKPGDIAIYHMNHPGSGTLPGLKSAIASLRARGFQFVWIKEFVKK